MTVTKRRRATPRASAAHSSGNPLTVVSSCTSENPSTGIAQLTAINSNTAAHRPRGSRHGLMTPRPKASTNPPIAARFTETRKTAAASTRVARGAAQPAIRQRMVSKPDGSGHGEGHEEHAPGLHPPVLRQIQPPVDRASGWMGRGRQRQRPEEYAVRRRSAMARIRRRRAWHRRAARGRRPRGCCPAIRGRRSGSRRRCRRRAAVHG